jgi:general nucleoside transport system permease protein
VAAALRLVFALRTVWATLLALLVGSLLIVATGADPVAAYVSLFGEAFFDYYGFAATLVKLSPILLAGLAVAVPLRAGLFNIGAEGQIYLGALFGTVAALHLPPMPGFLHILLCCAAGIAGGALWALVPAFLKAYHGINEVIVTLLMNYVGINIVSYAVSGPMMAEGAPYPYSPEIGSELWLPFLLPGTDAHVGSLVGLVLALLLYGMFRYTPHGLALDTVGRNPAAARYAGLAVRREMLFAMMLGGGLAGLAGIFEVLGLKYRLFHMFSAGYGFDGIVVAFMAGASPLFVPLAALFLSGLKAGASIMQRATGVESTAVDAIQGLVVMFVAASLTLRFQTTRWAGLLRRRREAEAIIARAGG